MGKTVKEMIRSYHIFLPRGWKRAAIYIIFPFLIMAVCILAGLVFPPAVYVLLIPGTCILWADGIIYFLLFGGYADKDSEHMEYIKSSDRGTALFHRALVVDAVRRFGSISLVFLAVLATVSSSFDAQMGIFLVGAYSISCLVAFAASFILGFLQTIIWSFLVLGILDISYVVVMVFFSISVVHGMHVGWLAAMFLLVIVLVIWAAKGQIAFLSKRMEGWYYDE